MQTTNSDYHHNLTFRGKNNKIIISCRNTNIAEIYLDMDEDNIDPNIFVICFDLLSSKYIRNKHNEHIGIIDFRKE